MVPIEFRNHTRVAVPDSRCDFCKRRVEIDEIMAIAYSKESGECLGWCCLECEAIENEDTEIEAE